MTGQVSAKTILVNQKLQVQFLRVWLDLLNWVSGICHYFYAACLHFLNGEVTVTCFKNVKVWKDTWRKISICSPASIYSS